MDFSTTSEPTDHGQITPVATNVKNKYESFIKNENELNESEIQIAETENIIMESVNDKGYQDGPLNFAG